ncbi:MAG: TRC40/GET3/ArsA family transport-energizing ATPase [Vicinamibacteria bacterium]
MRSRASRRRSPATSIPKTAAEPSARFLGGKGGTGKTTTAAAVAWRRAAAGERVLAVSLDPAHSLGDALGLSLGAEDRAVPGSGGRLRAVEVDAPRAYARWLARERPLLLRLAERGTYLRAGEIEAVLDLTLPGVDELMGLREVMRLAQERPDHALVVDLPPTGHALRLLEAPAQIRRLARLFGHLQAKHHALAEALSRRSAPDGADALIAGLEEQADAIDALLAGARFTWVTLPEPLSWEETRDALAALAARGLAGDVLVNRVTRATTRACAPCDGRRRAERPVLAAIAAAGLAAAWVPETVPAPRGREALCRIRPRPGLPETGRAARRVRTSAPTGSAPAGWRALAARRRLVVFAGKGGVGKTSAAAATALAAAGDGRRVLLLSADPAHSLADVLGQPADTPVPGAPSLVVRELDAARAFDRRRAGYRESLSGLWPAGPARSGVSATLDRALARDLVEAPPPGLDELFALLEIEQALGAERTDYDLVVLDSAPTGHALRLLAMPELAAAWTEALLRVARAAGVGRLASLVRELVDTSQGLRRLRALFADRGDTAVVTIAQADELAVRETARLHRALAARGLPPVALLVNGVRDGSCALCRRVERGQRLARRALVRIAGAGCTVWTAPLVSPPPQGPRALRAWSARFAPEAT